MQRIRRLAVFLAYAYPVALVIAILALRFGGARFWQLELALYAPRILFAAPLPFLVLLLLVLEQRRALWSQLVAALLVLFPLMGLVLPGWPRSPNDPKKTLRVLTYNGNFATGGQDELARQVVALDPDIAVFQQLFHSEQMPPVFGGRYPYMHGEGEFFIASRFPFKPPARLEYLRYGDEVRSPRFMRYELDTKLGPLLLYSVHPISPLYQFYAARSGGLRKAIATGALFSPARRPEIDHDTGLRALHVRNFATMAKAERLPVIIAGDTNLPGLAASLAQLSDFQDGFSAAGSGFGYTFPSYRPFMRIDRIFAGPQFRFLRFEVGSSLASDHRCVFAELELAN